MARVKSDRPEDYKGPRTPIRGKGTLCGWCNTENHEDCRHELAFYDKLWICSCKCNDGWVPQDLGGPVEEKNDKRRTSRKDNRASDDDSTGDELANEELSDEVSDNSDPEPIEESDDGRGTDGVETDGGDWSQEPHQGLGDENA